MLVHPVPVVTVHYFSDRQLRTVALLHVDAQGLRALVGGYDTTVSDSLLHIILTRFDDDIVKNSSDGLETRVLYCEKIASPAPKTLRAALEGATLPGAS